MNTIDVQLYPTPVAFFAEADIIPSGDARLHAFSDQSYVESIFKLRRGLAYLGETGRMNLGLNYRLFNNEAEEKQIDAAFALPDEELTITPQDTRRVRTEVAEEEKLVGEGIKKLGQFMDAQVADEEERDSITVGEVLRRYREGKERMRRIVEGEEPDADPEGSEEGERPPDPA